MTGLHKELKYLADIKMRLYTFPTKNNDPKAKAHYIKYCEILQKIK
jgi:hypothetical protein